MPRREALDANRSRPAPPGKRARTPATGAFGTALMREPAWMVKYQAREALKNGRPEDAHRLYDGLVSSGASRVWALRGDVIRGYRERAEKALRHHDVGSAWKGLTRVSAPAAPTPAGAA